MGRRVAGALLVVLVVALTACSSGGSDTGTVTGRLIMAGGPAPGVTIPVRGVVTATFADGHHAVAHVPRDGRFELHGQPGWVTVRGRSPQYGRGRGQCSSLRAVVKASSTVTADVICDMY